jgi:hypothetical protein
MVYIKDPLLLNRVHELSEGSLLADNLLQCMGEYSLVHQFADLATAMGHLKVANRLSDAVEKIGKLCIRYCARFLLQDEETTAMQYLRLAEAIYPGISSDDMYRQLQNYWTAPSIEAREMIVASINAHTNLAKRAISYSPPPGSIPC